MSKNNEQVGYWKYVTAFLSILSIVLAGNLTYYFSKKTQRQDSITKSQINAYIDFISGVVNSKKLSETKDEILEEIEQLNQSNQIDKDFDLEKLQSKLIDIKIKIAEADALQDSGRFRVILYGSQSSLDKMGDYQIYKSDSDEMYQIRIVITGIG